MNSKTQHIETKLTELMHQVLETASLVVQPTLFEENLKLKQRIQELEQELSNLKNKITTRFESFDVDSSLIKDIVWEQNALEKDKNRSGCGNLTVTFRKGSSYIYFDVSKEVYEEFSKSESKGAYYHSHVKACDYDFNKIC
jgi:hypothetical protein